MKNPLNAMTIHLELLKQKLGGSARSASSGDGGSAAEHVDVAGSLRHATIIDVAGGHQPLFNERGDTVNQVIGIYCVKGGKWEYLKAANIPADRLPK